jgi:hypothetical protein
MANKNARAHPWLMDRRYFSLIIVLTFVILSTVTFFLCYRHHTINLAQTLKEDRSTVNLLSRVLDGHFRKIISVMESYTSRPLMLQAVREKNAEKAMMHLISLTKSDPGIDILIITDRQGTLWANYPKRPEGLLQGCQQRVENLYIGCISENRCRKGSRCYNLRPVF